MTPQKTPTQNLIEYAKEISDRYKVSASIQDNKVSVFLPESMEQSKNLSEFWSDFFEYKGAKESIKKINFVYQENDKELPLSLAKKCISKLGFKIKPKKENGEIKYESIVPELLRGINNGIIRIIPQKEEWERLNKVSKNTQTFSTSRVTMLKPFCYKANIRLECILGIEFKEYERGK